ncbi:hypothetical protein F4781DRAFT_424718 [Annulohypoxylon bovei var. microspora]|nr:hypothetical protein F4781DRAFT_424718 [Annulohypoxylon bovei var. microspora]
MEEAANANKKGELLIQTPRWFIALRVLQIVFSLIALGMTGWWIHGLYYDELGFVIVCVIFTWVIAVYAILAEKVVSCRRAYNTWAILALDAVMIIFWLAAMAAVANRRSKFTVSVTADCYSDGSTINSGHCTISKRTIGVATQGALGVLSGIAAVSALIMLLFVATFAYVCHFFRLSFAAHSTNDPEKAAAAAAAAAGVNQGGVPGIPGATELQGGMPPQNFAAQQSQPLLPQQGGQQWVQQPGYPQQPAGQPQYQQGQAYDPYAPQNTAYAGAAGVYPQQVGTPAPGQPYSPQGTPAPGQPYQAPYHQPAQ